MLYIIFGILKRCEAASKIASERECLTVTEQWIVIKTGKAVCRCSPFNPRKQRKEGWKWQSFKVSFSASLFMNKQDGGTRESGYCWMHSLF